MFVRKKDRVTIQEKQRQVLRERELETEAKKIAEERKVQARRVCMRHDKMHLQHIYKPWYPEMSDLSFIGIISTRKKHFGTTRWSQQNDLFTTGPGGKKTM